MPHTQIFFFKNIINITCAYLDIFLFIVTTPHFGQQTVLPVKDTAMQLLIERPEVIERTSNEPRAVVVSDHADDELVLVRESTCGTGACAAH